MTEKVVCPHCSQEVEKGWLCSKCGRPLSTSSLLTEDPATTEFSRRPPAPITEADLNAIEMSASTIETGHEQTELPRSAAASPQTAQPTTGDEDAEAIGEQAEVIGEPTPEIATGGQTEASVPPEPEAGFIGEVAYEEQEEEAAAQIPPRSSALKGDFELPSLSEMVARIRRFFTFSGDSPDVYWRIVAIGIGLVLVAMLAGSAGLAILIGIFIVPIVILRYLAAADLFEQEPWWGAGSSAGAGLFGGLVIGGLGHFITDQLWIENAPLRVGSAGFAGEAADQAGSAPFSVLLLCGLVLPAIAEVVKLAGPVFLRQWPVFRNEVMDGITLAAAAGGGFAAGTAIVHFWPVITRGDSVGIGLSEWTGMLLGIAIVRPIIQVSTSALLGVAVWRYYLTQSTEGLMLPVIAGAGGAVFYGISDIIFQPAGTTLELLWSALIGAILLYFVRIVVRQAREQDATALGASGNRTVCPICRRVTPLGAYCANCGAPLGAALPSSTPVELGRGSS